MRPRHFGPSELSPDVARRNTQSSKDRVGSTSSRSRQIEDVERKGKEGAERRSGPRPPIGAAMMMGGRAGQGRTKERDDPNSGDPPHQPDAVDCSVQEQGKAQSLGMAPVCRPTSSR